MAVAFVAFTGIGHAMPASPKPLRTVDSDGRVVDVRVHGDEHFHVITDTECNRLLTVDASGRYVDAGAFDAVQFEQRRAAMRKTRGPARVFGSEGFPAHGKQRALAILVEYPETDEHPDGRRFTIDNPRQHFDDLLNKPGYNTDGATGSVRDYFLDASNGVFDLTFDVYGPVTLEHDLSFYLANENLNAWNMTEEACRALDSEIDYSIYDRDHNGVIDNVYIFYAGEGGATSANPEDCIWQHAADIEMITGRQFVFDNVRLNHYACSNEYRMVKDNSGSLVRQAEGIGTVCHEFSHVLGLPDFYDTSNMGIYTVGKWALMDTGCHLNDSRTPPNYTAIERSMLGWLDPIVIGTEPRSLSLREISTNEAYRINTPNPDEYFLLENRQLNGWDAYLPAHGMLVWHIIYSKDYWDANQVNTQAGRLGIDIVRADAIMGDDSLDGDVFPGSGKVTELTDNGYPNMLTNDGKFTEAPISRIAEAGGVITFDICKSVSQLGKTTGLKAVSVTPTSFTAAWDATTNAAGYVVNVYTRENGNTEPVGRYHDLNVSANSVEVTGLQPETTYYITVRAVAGTVMGEVSDECSVTTSAMSFGYTSPAGTSVAEVSDNSFKAVWEALPGAVDYSLNVYTKEAGEPVKTGVDFSDGLDLLPDGWVTNCSFTLSMNGYYGASAPALSMADDYGRLQSPLLPGKLLGLTFWYRERSGSGESRIEISVLEGQSWAVVDVVDLPSRMSEGVMYTLPSDKIPADADAVRIVYRRVSKGSLAIDDVVASYAGPSRNIALPAWNEKRLGSDATEAVVDGLQAATEYYFTVRGIDGDGVSSQLSDEVRVLTKTPGGINDAATSRLKITVDPDGYVNVSGAEGTVTVYDLYGRETGLRLPARGVYIVRVDGISEKIIY